MSEVVYCHVCESVLNPPLAAATEALVEAALDLARQVRSQPFAASYDFAALGAADAAYRKAKGEAA